VWGDGSIGGGIGRREFEEGKVVCEGEAEGGAGWGKENEEGGGEQKAGEREVGGAEGGGGDGGAGGRVNVRWSRSRVIPTRSTARRSSGLYARRHQRRARRRGKEPLLPMTHQQRPAENTLEPRWRGLGSQGQ